MPTQVSMDPMTTPKLEPNATLLATMKGKHPVLEITCYRCGSKGHHKFDCPSPEGHMAAMADNEVEDGVW